MRIGCRWCASIMTRWNASKSASLPKRCILPTDRFSTWYTCPPGAFRAALGIGKRILRSGGRRQYELRPCFRPASCVSVTVPSLLPSPLFDENW